MYRIYGIGLAIMAFGAMWAFDTYDKSVNYTKMNAEIFNVSSVCYMEKKEGKKKWVTEKGPCELARGLVQSHPGYKGYTVHETATIDFAYFVDGERYTGEQEQNSTRPIKLSDGDSLQILVHNDDPNKTRKP